MTNNNPLFTYFQSNEHRRIQKWRHFLDIYHRHFACFRNLQPTVVEFGVKHGGSLQMWKQYFGIGARIYGVDINPICKMVEEEGIDILIGDQADKGFLNELRDIVGPIDILIDDGGHTMVQQITTFEELYPSVSCPGAYVVEDLHTSYWRAFGGGMNKPSSAIEHFKRKIDSLNAWHIDGDIKKKQRPGFQFGMTIFADRHDRLQLNYLGTRPSINEFTRSTYSMSFYDSMLVFEKRTIESPVSDITGNVELPRR